VIIRSRPPRRRRS
ncbi:uncharacterized protein CELE_Y44E3A.7, partial [Caenorhabditis elegans]